MPLNHIEHITRQFNGLVPTRRGGWLECALRRFHRRGFGVQSPWAFRLVTEALFERLRFYAFDRMRGTVADEQLFRLVHWLRSERIYVKDVDEMGLSYMREARPDLQIRPFSSDEMGLFLAELDEIVANGSENTDEIDRWACLVVEDIRGKNAADWTGLLRHPRTTSTFDLGKRGIVFFNPAHQRQNYLL